MSGPPRPPVLYFYTRQPDEFTTAVAFAVAFAGFGSEVVYIRDRLEGHAQSTTRVRIEREWHGMQGLWKKEREECGCESCLQELRELAMAL